MGVANLSLAQPNVANWKVNQRVKKKLNKKLCPLKTHKKFLKEKRMTFFGSQNLNSACESSPDHSLNLEYFHDNHLFSTPFFFLYSLSFQCNNYVKAICFSYYSEGRGHECHSPKNILFLAQNLAHGIFQPTHSTIFCTRHSYSEDSIHHHEDGNQ